MLSARDHHAGFDNFPGFHAAGTAIRRFILRYGLYDIGISHNSHNLLVYENIRIQTAEENPEVPDQK